MKLKCNVSETRIFSRWVGLGQIVLETGATTTESAECRSLHALGKVSLSYLEIVISYRQRWRLIIEL